MKTKLVLTLLIAALLPTATQANPFEECPIEAFLVQDSYAKIYGVSLGTGYYQNLSNEMGTDNKLNAIGFNYHDAYLYAWSYEHGVPARIGRDYQVEPLEVDGLTDQNFYVGDISVEENAYFVYKSGSNGGLYRINLEGDGPYRMQQVVDGNQLSLKIYDFAFHPEDGFIYAVARDGELWRIDPVSGSSTALGDTGIEGTFGAAYFDVTGMMYVSRNDDGKIFRVDPTEASISVELFALGPASSNNDGARCALAPVVSQERPTIDFGDAPASYGTYLTDNGARHDQTGNRLFLGGLVDSEADAWVFPMSDDASNSADDDGVKFVTGLEAGGRAVISVSASEAGYLNAWIDLNSNGGFELEERLINQHPVVAGSNAVSIYLPLTSQAGNTWSRFRISSAADVAPTGGSPDGEVEDYQVEIDQGDVIKTQYPSANGWSTIAFEDTWPVVGDYDMNDVVVQQRTTQYRKSAGGALVGVRIEGQVVAIGASFHNGFAVRLPGVLRDQVIASGITFATNFASTWSPLEAGRREAIVIVAQDLWDHVDSGESCEFYRTSLDCAGPIQMKFDVFLPIDQADVALAPTFDPFIFASPGFYRDVANVGTTGRGLEIHLKNQAPTEAVEQSLFGQEDDNSSGAYFYLTEGGLPWALEISQDWNHPLSGVELIDAYPQFEKFVISSGEDEADWYVSQKANPELIFKEQ